MSKQYDHHWKKGFQKPGVPIEIQTEAQKRRKIRKKKRSKSLKPKSLPMSTIVYRIEPKEEGGNR